MSEKHYSKSHLIQEGSYGCAYTPQLPCKKSKASKNTREVGKILTKKNAQAELKIATLVQGITGWQRYFIVQEEDKCDAKNFKKFKDIYSNECKVLSHTRNESLTQLLSPYGGTAFYNLTITNSFDYMGSLRHMLEGVDKLYKQGICHHDLNEANILVDKNGTFRIIDFGISFAGDKLTENTVDNYIYEFFQPEYPPQPPEFSVIDGLSDGLSYAYTIKQTIMKKSIFNKKQRILGIPIASEYKTMDKFWAEDDTLKDGKYLPFFLAYWGAWDAWGLGVIFLGLLEKCFLLPNFVNNVWPEHGQAIKFVLKGLLDVDPRRRMKAGEALRLL